MNTLILVLFATTAPLVMGIEKVEQNIKLWHDCGTKGIVEDCELALANGASINKRDEGGANALHYATFNNHPEVVQLLAKKGANLDIGDTKSGLTALDLAAFYGYPEIVKILVEYGANNNPINEDGFSPVFRCMLGNTSAHADILRYLLTDGGVPHDTVMLDKLTVADVAKTRNTNNPQFEEIASELGIRAKQLPSIGDLMSDIQKLLDDDPEGFQEEAKHLGVNLEDMEKRWTSNSFDAESEIVNLATKLRDSALTEKTEL